MNTTPLAFETNGWSRIDISPAALDPVSAECAALGFGPKDYDLGPHSAGFSEYVRAPEYAGEYRAYGGPLEHCFLEKALEHYIGFQIIQPRTGEVGIDIGSCRSVAPDLAERLYGVTCYTQDLEYPAGVHGKCIGSNADDIPLQDGSVDFMCLHCTFEHFERQADTGFIREVARLLRPGGRVVILPLYLNRNYCNITGETNADTRATIGFDPDATHHCIIPEWANRFGRHYSPEALLARVWKPALEAGLAPELMRARNWDTVHPSLWLRWMLVLRQL